VDDTYPLAVLAEIAECGGAEQARTAWELITQLASEEAGADAAARQLADAYLNDPYLTRNPGD
jgi:hypothetical protein